jgi:hypothetical protein
MGQVELKAYLWCGLLVRKDIHKSNKIARGKLYSYSKKRFG